MEGYTFIDLDKYCLVLPLSYVNPFEDIETFESDLKRLNKKGKIIIDLLLCNGISPNRCVEIDYDGKKLLMNTMKITSTPPDEIKKETQKFYKENPQYLKEGVLPCAQLYLIKQGIPI